MSRIELKGCGTALVTPFKDGKVDYETFAALVRRQVAAGVHFLVPLGTTGETPCLEDAEKERLLEITMENRGGCPVVVGGGSNSLVHTLGSIRLLERYSPDAYLIVVPYYNKPVQSGLYEYFKAVAESTDKAVVLYNVPGRTGVNMTAETTLRLAEIPNIVAVKEASGNYAQISEIIRNAPDGFSVLSGNDDETLSLMATGAKGIISVASNIVPAEMAALASAMLDGRLAETRSMHHRLSPLFRACFLESNPIPVKAGMSIMGLMENELRLPLTPASAKTCAAMEAVLKGIMQQVRTEW